ncbi:MAG TPA: DUF4384 domain-containing protein [Kofleriaceae bacterium]|jgi:hypothetical protein|nr:DUF4384 domain-containing protein [Kofleriaceae bacterium]
MHLSALTLDAMALGSETPGAREHLAGCARCRGDFESAAALREHFSAQILPRTQPRKARPSWLVFAMPAFAVAVAVAVVALRPRPHVVAAPPPELAIKGDATWQVFANRNGQTFTVHDGARLEPGDRIRFAVIPDGAHYLLVASIDGAGTVSIYYPFGGSESAALPAGDRSLLPGSIVLDAAPGPERMFAIFSDEPVVADQVADQLRAIGAGGADAIREPHALTIANARAQTSTVFEKPVQR